MTKRSTCAAALFTILAALYFLTYSGYEISNDERILYDGVHSFAQHGNFWLGYTNPLRPPADYPNGAPVPSLDSEPMQIFAATPLFWLAELLPGFGLMQTVWLLNIIVTALTGVVLFYYGVLLGYRERTAIIGALLFGAATLAWPYSKTFFREPLFTLLALMCAYCLERWRRSWQNGHFVPIWLGAAVLMLIGAFAAKDAGFLLLPTLAVIVLPSAIRRVDRRALFIVGTLTAVLVIGVVLYSRGTAAGRYDLFGRIARAVQQAELAPIALAGYLISPGRSIWAFSPVLLLGFWGAARLARQKAWRQIAVPFTTLIVFVVGYAILQNVNWYGGLGWGPRYMLPVTPFFALLLLPVIDAFSGAAILSKGVTVGLIGLSVMIQLLGVLTPVNAYFAFLASESARLGQGIYGWEAGTWDLRYIPAVVVPHEMGRVPSDLAWQVNAGTGYVAVLCGGLIVLAMVSAWDSSPRLNQQSPLKWTRGVSVRFGIYTPALLIMVLVIGLHVYSADPRYGGRDPAPRALIDALARDAKPDDAVLLNDEAYRPYFMNFYKGSAPIYLLPDAPGEVVIPGTPPQVTSSNLDKLAAPILSMMLPRLAQIAPRWWFVTEFTPADPSRTRATEHYLVRHYFPIRETLTTNTARLIEFSAASAPPDSIPPWPAVRSAARFDNMLALTGYDAPITIKRGGVLPVSLMWRFDGWPAGKAPFDYSVNVSLIDPNGAVVPGAQRAGTPLGTFGLMSRWATGDYYRDNHGLAVPVDLPPGVYHVWVLVYNWADNSRLPLSVNGAAVGDHIELMEVKIE